MKIEILILAAVLSVSTMGCGKSQEEIAADSARRAKEAAENTPEKLAEKQAKKEKLDACFMFSVRAAREGTNDAPRDSPEYKEIYHTAFDACLKASEPQPAPKKSGGAALQDCVMSNNCDANTSRMLNSVAEKIYR